MARSDEYVLLMRDGETWGEELAHWRHMLRTASTLGPPDHTARQRAQGEIQDWVLTPARCEALVAALADRPFETPALHARILRALRIAGALCAAGHTVVYRSSL